MNFMYVIVISSVYIRCLLYINYNANIDIAIFKHNLWFCTK